MKASARLRTKYIKFLLKTEICMIINFFSIVIEFIKDSKLKYYYLTDKFV